MAEKQPTLDTLEAENYTIEQSLSYQNRKALSKMFHYIHTFPLEMYDYQILGGIMCVIYGLAVAGMGLTLLNGGEMLGGGHLNFIEVAVTLGCIHCILPEASGQFHCRLYLS